MQDPSTPLNAAWLGSILEQSFNEIYIFDARTLQVLYANAGACLNMQYTLEEMRLFTPFDLGPDYSHEWLDAVLRPLREGKKQSVTFEGLRRRKDGSTYAIEARVQLFDDPDQPILVNITTDITERKRNEEKLRELSAHLLFAREEERTRIARDIHDELAGILTAIRYELALPVRRREDKDDSGAENRRRTMADLVDQVIQSLRRIIDNLRPSILDHLGLWAALEWQAQDFQERTGIPCLFEMEGDEPCVSPDLATAIFRIYQEVLTNIVRHAGATAVDIDVAVFEEEVTIKVRDNGRGIIRDQLLNLKSHGILGIHERARQFKGTVRFSGKEGKGTTVTIKFPLE